MGTRRQLSRRKRRGSNPAIILIVCFGLGGLILVGGIGAFLLLSSNVLGGPTYPNLTPEEFQSKVKAGMTETQAVAALGPPTRRAPIAEQFEKGGVIGGYSAPVKTAGIRLIWVIHSDGKSWRNCTADLDRDGGTIVSLGHGSGTSN